jgi:hypothetical protein
VERGGFDGHLSSQSHTTNPHATPFELWYKVKPDISHLHPVGCTAYAKVPTEAVGGLNKLAPLSVKCILIGYFGRDAYWLYEPEKQTFFQSRDVMFEEGLTNKTIPLCEEWWKF